MKQIIGLDVETSKIPNHYPWKDQFYLTCVSVSRPDNTARTWFFRHKTISTPVDYTKQFAEIEAELNKYDMVAAHNLKFDLNVLRSHVSFPTLWCTMVAEYMIKYHSNKGLSLDVMAPTYGLGNKLDKVKLLWESGLDTEEIPKSLLVEYCEDDAYKARKIAEKQQYKIKSMGLEKCFTLQMEWLNLLSEMECNGINFDVAHANKLIAKYTRYQAILERSIFKHAKPYMGDQVLNLSSNDDLSALIYGGVVKRRVPCPVIKTKNIKVQMPYVFTYKDGTKKIKVRYSQHPDTRVIRMVLRDKLFPVPGIKLKPLPKTETAKSKDPNNPQKLFKVDKVTLEQLQVTGHRTKTDHTTFTEKVVG